MISFKPFMASTVTETPVYRAGMKRLTESNKKLGDSFSKSTPDKAETIFLQQIDNMVEGLRLMGKKVN